MATVTKPIALDESLNTTEQTPRNVADVLAQELARIAGRQASDVNYDNTDSGLTADNVQDAIDELKSDIPTVNDGTLTIQQNGETKETFTANQSGNSTVNIETPTTDIQTAVDEFSTYNGGLLSECKVALSLIQDLHGYDYPWVAGAGKNKLKVTASSATVSGITFTVNADGTVTANGTATADAYINVTPSPQVLNIEPDTDYIVSGCPQGGSANTYYLLPRFCGSEYGTGVSARWSQEQSASGIFVNLYVKSGYTANNLVFKPMIRLATESDPTFEPYSNICPITGHTQVEVDVSDGQTTQEQITVNLGGTYYSGTLDVVSGELTVDSAFIASYNGETLPSTWISDRDVYAVGTTPTTGAEVCYKLATPQSIQLSPTMVKALVGENHLSAPLEGQEITESKYKQMFTFDDVIAYIQSLS